MPEYLTFSEVRERWNCGEVELKKLVLGRQLVASYFFSSEVAKVVKRFRSEEHGGTTIWIPELVQREELKDNSDLPPHKLVWVNGFQYLVYPWKTGPITGWFSFLSPLRDFREDVGGECYWYSPKSKPSGLSMEEVISGGALMLSEVERYERLQDGGGSSATPSAHMAKNSACEAPAAVPVPSAPAPAKPVPVVSKSAAQRQEERWQACIDAGLTMPIDTYTHLPRGVGRVAKALKITRQALGQDLNAHRERLFGK
ncbi:MAG TPA: hypothetical protein PKC60_05735 [Hydrogenophaga sp.]|uniref:hypothetical protein n=1 Tax=Hydrogenophaga sp. TaxID=1904254 RepID=UPI002B9E2392|nr:hypothetical protein [Hydrogenophaga sp.]HMN92715.1 hypothetical protein [Hydrogenophaga sp.]HMP08873.1 hypothetical protein [Hydrogenophaga sp.]